MRAVLALFLASVCFAQQPGRVEGRVLTTSGAPVSKATVRLTAPAAPGQQPTVFVELTSSDGRFVAENVAPGRYNVNAQRQGYALARTTTGAVASISVEVAAGETKSGIEIRLTPLAVISGMVTDADGEPVPNVQVRLLRYAFAQGRLALTNTTQGNSDDRGMFRLSNLQPGRYYLSASPAGVGVAFNEIRGRSAQELNLPTYYPNAAEPRGAVALTVDSAELSNVNIRMLRGSLYSIKGNIVGPDGAAVSGQVSVFPKGGDAQPPGMNLQLRDPGIFQLTGLPSGEYTLVVRGNPPRPAPPAPGTNPNPVIAPPAQAAQLSGRIDVTLGSSNLENVVIRLTTGAEVTGKITVEGGVDLSSFGVALPGVANAASRQAAGGAAVPAQAPPLRLPSVMLASIEGPSAQLMSIANPDGTFRIANVPPLKRVLQVSLLPPNAYIKSVRFRGQDATRTPLDLSTGSGGVLDILIGIKGAEITATPRDEKGEAPQGTSVSIWPRTPNPGSPTGDARVTITGGKVQGLAPGEYYVAAWETPDAALIRVPEFLARFNSLATKLSVAEGESISVEPKIIPRQTMEKEAAQFP